MSTSLMIQYVLISIVIAAGMLLLAYYLPKIKGKLGERKVSKILATLPSDKYRIINDTYLKKLDEAGQITTVQIDHIVVSIYGIFVIETKNYQGIITGSDNKSEWVQHLGKNKYKLYNPIWQNYGHIKILEELLQLDNKSFISIVVFNDNAKITSKNAHVGYISQLKKMITAHSSEIIPYEKLDEIESIIRSSDLNSKEVQKAHVNNIRQTVEQKDNMVKQGICPRCNGALVMRKGKYGTFLGCSNYPKCKFTIKNKRTKVAKTSK